MEALKENGYNKSIGEELNNVDSQIEKCKSFLEESKSKQSKMYISEQEVRDSVEKIKDFVKKNSVNEIQAMIRQYVKRVTIFQSHIEVTYTVAFSFCKDKKINYNWSTSLSIQHLKYLGEHRLFCNFSQNYIDRLASA